MATIRRLAWFFGIWGASVLGILTVSILIRMALKH
jgi:cellobiose-specific phosphotransferase system component IIC